MESKTTITKLDLSSYISKHSGLNVKDCSDIVDLFFNIISDGIVQTHEVKIMKLGTFSIKYKKNRIGRNPKTGEVTMITSHNVISFKPAKLLKKIVKC